ncbi:hypothetical protein LP416_12575 [Polaromonas sp. P2-4]|nr:hypothetical protein LP416_12575 [Polaromonas sp. P2-4]
MLIHFVHTGDAYLPELQAYAAFVQAAGHQAEVHGQIQTLPADAAVLWWMCGQVSPQLAQRYPSAFHIHEYASASVPPLAWLKDSIKRWRQAVPQYRIYQNEWVRQRMGFGDAVPYEFRNMGVSPAFSAHRRHKPNPNLTLCTWAKCDACGTSCRCLTHSRTPAAACYWSARFLTVSGHA